jgi:hypothetical protein
VGLHPIGSTPSPIAYGGLKTYFIPLTPSDLPKANLTAPEPPPRGGRDWDRTLKGPVGSGAVSFAPQRGHSGTFVASRWVGETHVSPPPSAVPSPPGH